MSVVLANQKHSEYQNLPNTYHFISKMCAEQNDKTMLMDTFLDTLPDNISGGYASQYKNYIINSKQLSDKLELKKTLLHEIQHQIQEIEGFSDICSRKATYINRIEKLKKKIAKKAREPFSFWCTFFGAFADLFR